MTSGTPSLMQAALDAGITHFDSTAAQPQQMRNEEMIGKVERGHNDLISQLDKLDPNWNKRKKPFRFRRRKKEKIKKRK